MACTVCGSNVGCGCRNTVPLVNDPAFCCNQVQPGCCQNVVTPVPTPFYAGCAPSCPESHTQNITVQSFAASVKIADSWNVPVCDGSAVVNIVSLHALVVGSYLWNPQYGYFQVTAFNSGTGQTTLLNNCNAGNASPGTAVPACTDFTVTVPPCDCGDSSQVCVAIDFTAPAVGNCIDITLTGTTGITVGGEVQIGSGIYRVSAIKPNEIITICNDGEGITPGTSVIAKNAAGNYQYCLQIISVNPCDSPVVKDGIALVCNTELIKPISGLNTGWVLTDINATTNDQAYRPLGSTNCTTIPSAIVLVAGTANYSNVPVGSSAGFTVGDVLDIEGGQGYRFHITGIPDSTHINFTVVPSPGNITFPAGSVLCVQSCCETLAAMFDDLNFYSDNHFLNDDAGHSIDTIGGPTSFDTAHTTWTITNPNVTKSMKVATVFMLNVNGNVSGDNLASTYLTVASTIKYKINGGAPFAPFINNTYVFLDPADTYDVGISMLWEQEITILPGASATVEMWYNADVAIQPAGGGGIFFMDQISLDATQVGVPV